MPSERPKPERRGRSTGRPGGISRDLQIVRHSQDAGLGRLVACESQSGSRRDRRGDDRAVRDEARRQPLQALESDEFRQLFSAAGKGCADSEEVGGRAVLGIPTVTDRIAQTTVKMWLEPRLDPLFHDDSYGYRPGKSALEAIAVTRRRCWDQDWVVEFDIRGLFDNLDHALLMTALRKHCQEPWILLYVERWLKRRCKARMGSFRARDKGTPQGGVMTP